MMVWDDELIIYHHKSGDTYFFTDFAKQVICFCLSRESFSENELLQADFGYFDSQQKTENFIQSILGKMIQLNLITEEAL